MKKNMAKEMWIQLIGSAIHHNTVQTIKNPMLELSTPEKAAVFNDLSEEQYADMVESCMEQSYTLWREKDEESVSALLMRAFEKTDIDFECMSDVCNLLAEASEKTKYRTEPATEWERRINELEVQKDIDRIANEMTGKEGNTAELEEWFPKAIEKWIHTTGGIVGQDAAVKAASMILYNHINGRPSVSLFAAPTGSGKTQLWRSLQRLCGTDSILIHDASSLTAEGWKGSNKISTIFKSIPPEKRGHVILVLDEFDKLIEPQYAASGTNYADIVQNQLLKLFDHDFIFYGSDTDGGFTVDASGVSVVLLGAFQRLLERKGSGSGTIGFGGTPQQTLDYTNTKITFEDLVSYGMREEIAGRITRITTMTPLGIDDYVRIGRNEVENLKKVMKREITVEDNTLALLALTAVEKGLGARWLKSKLSNMLDDLVYEDPEAAGYKIHPELSC